MGKKKVGASKTTQRNLYKMECRYRKNKEAKIKRHLKKYPNDVQAQEALEDIPEYSRKPPRGKHVWSPEDIRLAALMAPINRAVKHLDNYRPRDLPKRPKLVDSDPNLNTLMHIYANK